VNHNVVRGDVLEAVAHGLLPAVTAGDDRTPVSQGAADSVERLRWYDENHGITSGGCKHIERPFDERPATELLKLFEC
jgi:hypothetical protein